MLTVKSEGPSISSLRIWLTCRLFLSGEPSLLWTSFSEPNAPRPSDELFDPAGDEGRSQARTGGLLGIIVSRPAASVECVCFLAMSSMCCPENQQVNSGNNAVPAISSAWRTDLPEASHFSSPSQELISALLPVFSQRMPTTSAGRDIQLSSAHHYASTITLVAASACLIWYLAVVLVCSIGVLQLYGKSLRIHFDLVLIHAVDGATTRGHGQQPPGATMLRM